MASPEIFLPPSPSRETLFSPLRPGVYTGERAGTVAREKHDHPSRPRKPPSALSPTEVTTLDHQIAAAGGTTSTLENIPNRLRASGSKQPVSQKQWMEELTKDNGYLRQELAYYKDLQQALFALHHETNEIFTMLQNALETFSERWSKAEKPLLDYWNIDFDHEEAVII